MLDLQILISKWIQWNMLAFLRISDQRELDHPINPNLEDQGTFCQGSIPLAFRNPSPLQGKSRSIYYLNAKGKKPGKV